MVLLVISHNGDGGVGGKTSKREMSSSCSYSDLQKLVKVTSTSASLSYVDNSGDVIAIENDEGHHFLCKSEPLKSFILRMAFVLDWRLFVKYAPQPYKITITDTASSISSSSSSSGTANSQRFSKAGSNSGNNGGSLNDRYKWSNWRLLLLFIGQLVTS